MKINAATIEEAKIRFRDLKDTVGKNLALFICCAFCNLPYIEDVKADAFDGYLLAIGSSKKFRDGITDYAAAAESKRTKEERWQAEWGFGAENNKYTETDYTELDKLFERYSSRLVAAGGYDKMQEDTLRHCCRLALERNKCVAKGGKENVDMAAKLDKMIQDNLGSENLRKKDAKPVDEAKVDAITAQMEKKFKLAMDMTKDQFFAAYHQWLRKNHYPITADAAEHGLLTIINATRRNNDEQEMTELPKEMRFPADSEEFEKAPNKQEEKVYEYLDIERQH